jgi:hypothetical protein
MVDKEAFERLKAKLTLAFAAPEAFYKPLSAAEVIARNRGQTSKLIVTDPNHSSHCLGRRGTPEFFKTQMHAN